MEECLKLEDVYQLQSWFARAVSEQPSRLAIHKFFNSNVQIHVDQLLDLICFVSKRHSRPEHPNFYEKGRVLAANGS